MSGGVTVVRLGEVVRPTRPRVKPSERPELPFIGMEHIEAHSMKLLGTVSAGGMKSSAVHFKPGDVLYGRLRPYLNKVYRPSFEGLCSAEFIVLPENERIDGAYLQYFLNSAAFVRYATHLNAGDRPRVDFDQIAPYSIPLPGKDEQHRIVAEIEKQFSRVDEAVANLKRVKANLKRYKAAVLNEAVAGLPVRPLGTLLREPLRNGHSAKATADPQGLRAFTLTAVTEGNFSLTNTKPTVADSKKVADLWAEPGDIYIERSNTPELVGTARLYRGPRNFAFIPDLLIRVRVSDELMPEFVEIALQSDHARRYFRSKAQGIAGSMPKIDQAAVESFPLPYAARQQQQKIASNVDRRLTIFQEVETEVDVNLRRAHALRHAVLANAFR